MHKEIQMKITHFAVAALALAAVVSAQSVSYNFDRSADFAAFKTYRWVEMPGGVKLDQITANQLTAALDAAMAARGLTKTDSETADLYVGYTASLTQQQQINAYGMGGGWRFGGGMATATTSTITNGAVALDMYDSAKKQLVWRGVATKTIDTGANPSKREKNIQTAATKLLKNYPPKTT
jgi:hypothetical protein